MSYKIAGVYITGEHVLLLTSFASELALLPS